MRRSTFLDRNSFIWIFGFALSQFNPVVAFTQCYYPDGSIPTDYVWEPCTGAQYSSCCIPSEGDICQPNGLCYYPPNGQLYRGTCTDRTWNDSSCPSSICVTGFETTWDWVVQCDGSGSSSFACGSVSDGQQAATCSGSAATDTASIQTTTTTSSAGRYTSPPPINTYLYSVYTDTYTTIITANAQTTTLTSTFESTLTSTLHPSTALSAISTNTAASQNAVGSGTKRGVLTTGLIIAIIVGPTLALILGIGIFIFLRKRSSRKSDDAIRLNSSSHPPPNGPVGADQVNPYEMANDETATRPYRKKYEYSSPRVDAYEVSGGQGVGREEKRWDVNGNAPMEMDGFEQQGLRSPRSPAPVYSEAVMPVELDGTSSFGGGRYAR